MKVRAPKSCHNFSQRTLTIYTSDRYNWTLISCFGAFLSVWVHLGPFRYCTKLGAKRARLVQLIWKFMPRSRVIIFHNERSRSTTLDPKLMFWGVSFRSGTFGTVSLLHENAPNWCNSCKSSSHDVLLEFFTTNAPDPYHWRIISSFGAFLSVWVHLEPFRYCTKLGAKAPNWCN